MGWLPPRARIARGVLRAAEMATEPGEVRAIERLSRCGTHAARAALARRIDGGQRSPGLSTGRRTWSPPFAMTPTEDQAKITRAAGGIAQHWLRRALPKSWTRSAPDWAAMPQARPQLRPARRAQGAARGWECGQAEPHQLAVLVVARQCMVVVMADDGTTRSSTGERSCCRRYTSSARRGRPNVELPLPRAGLAIERHTGGAGSDRNQVGFVLQRSVSTIL